MKRWIAPTQSLRGSTVGALAALMTIASAHVAPASAPAPQAGVAIATSAPISAAHETPRPTQRRASVASLRKKPASHAAETIGATVGVTPGAAGMKAAIDPVTGRLVRPTAAQIEALEAQAGVRPIASGDDPARGITLIQLANGAEFARLDERFQEYEVVRLGADGKRVRGCVHGPEGAARFQKNAKIWAQPATPAPVREVK